MYNMSHENVTITNGRGFSNADFHPFDILATLIYLISLAN